MSEKDIIKRSDKVYTKDILIKEFQKIGLKEGMNVLVHSSLSKIGWITGGAVTVIQALMETITSKGNIVMPAHSGDYSDPNDWSNPPVPKEWIDDIKENMPAFRSEVTPTRGVGVIPELFRTFPEVKRSYHPCFSFSAWGQEADYITRNHSLDYGLGENSPLGKFYNLGGKVLLIGVNYDRNTSFHLSEVKSGIKDVFTNGAPVIVNGKRKWKEFKDIEFDSDVFNQIGEEFEKNGEVKIKKIGQADSKLFDQPEAVDFATDWLIKNDE